MIAWDEYADWVQAQGLDPKRCGRIEIVPIVMEPYEKEPQVWLRATQIVQNEKGLFLRDETKQPPEVLEEIVMVRMVSLP